jgi:hypothetical protein
MNNKRKMEKKRILLSHKELNFVAGKWMELENIILSEVGQAQKAKNHMFSLIYGLYT